MFSMMALMQIVREDDVLAGYLWQVIEKPGLLSVLTGLGVRSSLKVDLARSVPAAALPRHLPMPGPGMVVQLVVDVNGAPALFGDVLAVGPLRPWALCGGLVAMSARHPTRDDLHFDVALLAARLGR